MEHTGYKKKHYKEQIIIMRILVYRLTFRESPLRLYYHDNHTGNTTETTTSQPTKTDYKPTKTLPVIMIHSFQTSVTDVRC